MLNVLLPLSLIVSGYHVDISKLTHVDTDAVYAPVIINVSEFTEESADMFAKDVQRAVNMQQPFIPIFISSYGGSVYALLEMIDTLQAVRVPIATVCVGKCMSAGAVLLAAGTDGWRFAAPNATILLHDVSSSTSGKVKDMVTDTAEATRLNNLLFTFIAKQSKQPLNFFLNMLDKNGHIDLYLTAEQTKAYGIVNHTRQPTVKLKIKTDMTLN